MVNASNKAIEELQKKLVDTCFQMGIGFRIHVSNDESGKSVFSMKLDRQHEGDEVTELDGIKVFLDAASAAQARGYQLHYHDEPGGEFFLLTDIRGNKGNY